MLRIENLTFGYKNNPILKGITFEIVEKSVTCVIGPNGSGKTSLLDCIMGLHQDYAGLISFQGEDVQKMKVNHRMQRMSYVPQSKTHTFPFTVLDMVVMGRAPYMSPFQRPTDDDKQLALEALKNLKIENFQNRIFTKLSGGEQQLVLLARALTQDTDLLILDEPMVSLDYYNELQFLEVLSNLVLKYNKSIIMATHTPNHAFFFAEKEIDTQVLMLRDGKVVGFGSPNEILNHNNLHVVYNIKASVITYDETKQFIIPKSVIGE
ncbi:ABC transporter ATP-binding protein [Fusibacter bizertensis]